MAQMEMICADKAGIKIVDQARWSAYLFGTLVLFRGEDRL